MPNSAPEYQRQVGTRPLDAPLVNPGIASASSDAIATGFLQGATGIAKAGQIRAEQDTQAAQTKAMAAMLRVADEEGQLTSQSLTKTGDMRGLPSAWNLGYGSIVQKNASDLKDDPEAQKYYQQMAERRRVQVGEQIVRHADTQTKVYNEQTFEGGAEQSRQDLYNGIISVDDSLKQQQGIRLHLADLSGEPKEITDLKWQADKDKTLATAIGLKADAEDSDGAKALLVKYGDQMSAVVRSKTEQLVLHADMRAKGQTEADRIWNPDTSLEQMNTEADKITDQNVQAQVKTRLDARYRLHQEGLQKEGTDLLKGGLSILNTPGKTISDIPPSTLQRLNEINPSAIDVLRQKMKKEDVTTPEGNALVMRWTADLSGANGDEARARAVKQDPNQAAGVLSQADLRMLGEKITAAKLGHDMSSEADAERIAAVTLKANGYDPELHINDGKGFNFEGTAFRHVLNQQIALNSKAGKKPTPADIQIMANRLMLQMKTGDGWLGPITTPTFMFGMNKKDPASALGGGVSSGAYAMSLHDFSETEIDDARAKLKAGKALTDEQSVLRFLRAQAVDGNLKKNATASDPNYYGGDSSN